MEKQDFDNSLRVTKIALLISGVKVSKTKFGKWVEYFIENYLFYFTLAWVYMDIYGEIHWIIQGAFDGVNFVYLSISGPLISITVLGTLKVTFLFVNRDVVIEIIDKLREIHPEATDFGQQTLHIDDIEAEDDKNLNNEDAFVAKGKKTNAEKEIVIESMKMIKTVVLLLCSVFSLAAGPFVTAPIPLMAYEYFTTGTTDLKIPYLVKYFFDSYVSQTIIYPFIYFHLVVSTTICCCNVIGSDTLLYVACIYLKMHFSLLCFRLKNVVTTCPEETRKNVASAAKRHQELIQLANQLESVYNKSLLFNAMTSCVIICLSGFIMTVVEDLYVAVCFATFLIMSLSQVGLLCYFGDMMMLSSTQISSAVYHSRWYEADQRTKKSLLLILMRGQTPCKLTAWTFVDLNLTAFSMILSKSWSYFALLRTMYK